MRQRAARAVAHPGDVRDELLERRVGEGVELHLHDRPQPVHRHADGRAEDARLGERGVGAAVLAELRGQPVGDPEDAAERADVLAEDVHVRVLGERVAQGAVEGLRHRGGLAGPCPRGLRPGGAGLAGRARAVPIRRSSAAGACLRRPPRPPRARRAAGPACSRSCGGPLRVDVVEQVHRVAAPGPRSSASRSSAAMRSAASARLAYARVVEQLRARAARAPAGRPGRARARPSTSASVAVAGGVVGVGVRRPCGR